MVSNSIIRDAILERLYIFNFNEEEQLQLEQIMSDLDITNIEFDNNLDRLVDNGFIKAWATGYNYQITSSGVIKVEELDIPPKDLVSINNEIRTKTLVHLNNVFNEKGKYGDMSIEDISQETGHTSKGISDNLDILDDLGYVEHVASTLYKITFPGIDAVEEYLRKETLNNKFQKIKELKPQKRGISFQSLVSDLIERSGWSSEVSLRTDHEEMDVVFSKGREYYIIECKWEKDPIGPSVVRELFGKLSNRIGIQGILFSMSGFTSGAIKQAIKYASQKLILFFGPEDFSKLISEGYPFEDMLNRKYKAYVTKNEIVYS